jgi:acyl dehydratase
MEALVALHYLFATQAQLGRAEFKAMTGLGERVATGMLSALLRRGFLASDTPYGDVRFAVPRHALRFYFPVLWPEAEQDQALLQAELKVSGTARATDEEFRRVAEGRWTKVLDTGKTVPWDDAKAYLEMRALGGRARKPAAGKRRP